MGWTTFYAQSDGLLKESWGNIWPSSTLVATCSSTKHPSSEIPFEECSCGITANRLSEALREHRYFIPTKDGVVLIIAVAAMFLLLISSNVIPSKGESNQAFYSRANFKLFFIEMAIFLPLVFALQYLMPKILSLLHVRSSVFLMGTFEIGGKIIVPEGKNPNFMRCASAKLICLVKASVLSPDLEAKISSIYSVPIFPTTKLALEYSRQYASDSWQQYTLMDRVRNLQDDTPLP